jgi:hypothetical protein
VLDHWNQPYDSVPCHCGHSGSTSSDMSASTHNDRYFKGRVSTGPISHRAPGTLFQPHVTRLNFAFLHFLRRAYSSARRLPTASVAPCYPTAPPRHLPPLDSTAAHELLLCLADRRPWQLQTLTRGVTTTTDNNPPIDDATTVTTMTPIAPYALPPRFFTATILCLRI